MSGLGLDMSGLSRICPVWGGGWICLVTRNFEQRKSRLGAKTMGLGPSKLTIGKLDNIELREITRITRSKLNSRNQT
jgi:hypothetical protein